MYFIIHTVFLLSRVKGHKRSPVLPRLIASIVGGSLLWRAHFESLRVAEAKNAATINRLMSKRRSVLYFPNSTLLSRVKGHKGSPVLPRLLQSIVMGSLLRRAHFGAWSRANKGLGYWLSTTPSCNISRNALARYFN